MSAEAELEDRVRELERELYERESELFALRRQLAAAQAWSPVADGVYGDVIVNGNKLLAMTEFGITISTPLFATLPDSQRFCERRAPAQEWTPVADGYVHIDPWGVILRADGETLTVEYTAETDVELPDDVRLCSLRAPAQEEATTGGTYE